jgi:hypothetical protein
VSAPSPPPPPPPPPRQHGGHNADDNEGDSYHQQRTVWEQQQQARLEGKEPSLDPQSDLMDPQSDLNTPAADGGSVMSPPPDEVHLHTQYLLNPAFLHKQLQRKKQHQKQQLLRRAQQQQLKQLNGTPTSGGAGVGSGVRGGEDAGTGEGNWWHSTGRRRDRMGSFYGAQGLESQRQDRYRAAHHTGTSVQWKEAVHHHRRNSTATAAALAAPATSGTTQAKSVKRIRHEAMRSSPVVTRPACNGSQEPRKATLKAANDANRSRCIYPQCYL